MEDDKDFIHQHPLMTTATALGAGLLLPIGVGALAQYNTEKSENTKPGSLENTQAGSGKQDSNSTDADFIHEHPLMTTVAALVIGLLAPLGLGLLTQGAAESAESEDSGDDKAKPGKTSAKAKDRESTNAAGADFIHEHPLMTTVAALTIGLLAPLGLSLLTPGAADSAESEESGDDKAKPGKASAKANDRESTDAAGADFIHEHPLMTTVAALTIGLLAPLGLSLLTPGAADSAESEESGDDKAKPGKASAKTSDLDATDDFIHQHPLMTTAAALAIGLLVPLVLGLLTQGASDSAGSEESGDDKAKPGKTSAKASDHGSTDDFIHQHPLMTTVAALVVGLLAPLGLGLLTQDSAGGEDSGDDKAKPGKTSAKAGDHGTTDDFIHQHPLMTTVAALVVGLLAPLGLGLLTQNDSENPKDTTPARATAKDSDHAAVSGEDLIRQHPFMTTAAALAIGLLLPIGLSLLTQGNPESAATNKADEGKTKDRDSTGMPDADFAYAHPFITTTAALGIGLLLGPSGLSLLAQSGIGKPEATQDENSPPREAVTGKIPPEKNNAVHADEIAEDFTLQHPFITTAAALGMGLLSRPLELNLPMLQSAGKLLRPETKPPQWKIASTKPVQPAPFSVTLPWRHILPQSKVDRGPHDVGALDMEFTTRRPNGKNIEFSFGWKKRPVDAPETSWPVDNMGFTVDRPSGKHVGFKFTRKTRPVPVGYGNAPADNIRPGLGQAAMKFASSSPDRGEFRFTWEKIPPGVTPIENQHPTRSLDDNKSGFAETIAVEPQEKHSVSKPPRKTASG